MFYAEDRDDVNFNDALRMAERHFNEECKEEEQENGSV